LPRTGERETLLDSQVSYPLSLHFQLVSRAVISFQMRLAEGMPAWSVDSALYKVPAHATLQFSQLLWWHQSHLESRIRPHQHTSIASGGRSA
jgi:hypothetical protein